MNIIKKLNSIYSVKEEKVDAAEVWMVSWNSYYVLDGCSVEYPQIERKAKAFLSKEDAQSFIDGLHKALDILEFDLNIMIESKRQK